MKGFISARFRQSALLAVGAALLGLLPAMPSRAQVSAAKADPALALEELLDAACRQDENAFASRLTTANAAAFRNLPAPRRSGIIKRFVLLEDPGKPLLTTSSDGHPVLRCEAAGVIDELRFGPTEARDNLAFIRVDVPQAGQGDDGVQHVRFGLVRESGEWKLLSMGLLLLDIPELQREWDKIDAEAPEDGAVDALHQIGAALKRYQAAYGKLPDTLDQLGSSSDGSGLSADKAGLLDNQLASGESGGYNFRYVISAANVPGEDSDREKAATFSLAATPVEYGKSGKQSFYVDMSGVLHGADKHGAVATVDDPVASGAPANAPQ